MPAMLLSWCPGQQDNPCNPCKPPPPPGLPPPAGGGSWKPPPVTAIQVWYYMIQPGTPINNYGALLLDGIGAQWITSAGSGPIVWGPITVSDSPDWGGAYIDVGIDYVDGAGPHFTADHYGSMADAQAVAQEFNNYYFG